MQLFSSNLVTFKKTSLASLLVVVAMVFGQPAYAIQDGSLPPIHPADAPDNNSPFENYVQEETSVPVQENGNPFQDYVSGESRQQQNDDQNIEQNNLRGSVSPVMPQRQESSTQPLPPSRAAPPVQAQPIPNRTAVSQPVTPGVPGNRPVIVDPNLQPTTYNAPTPPSSSNVELARNLLNELSVVDNMTESEGQAMGLQDLLVNSSYSKRKQLIYQYWRTYGAWAEYRFAMDQLRWLQQIGQTRSESDRATLEAAQSAARDEVAARGLEMTHQQNLLDEYISGPQSETLPLPSDKPLVGRYRTHYDMFASKRTMPRKMRAIHHWLPRQQQLLSDRAATVQRCRNAVMQATRGISQGQPVTSILQSMEMSRECHSEFITTVVRYNQRIAEYALTVKPNQNAAEQVVAMLIPVTPIARDLPANNQTRQAALPESTYGQGNILPLRPASPPSAPMDNAFQRGSSLGNQPAANRQPAINPGGFGARQNYQPPPTQPGTTGGMFRR